MNAVEEEGISLLLKDQILRKNKKPENYLK